MKMPLRKKCIVILCAAVLLRCGEKPTAPNNSTTALQIVVATQTVFAGGSLQLVAVATLRDGTQSEVTAAATWSLSPGKAAAISNKGMFTAASNAIGTEVVAIDYHGLHAETQIEVVVRATSLVIWPAAPTIANNQALQLEAIAEMQNNTQVYVTDKVTWRLSPGVAARIAANGLLTPQPGMSGEEVVMGTFQSFSAQSRIQIKESFTSPIALVTIPAGTFVMGSESGEANEKPAHEVSVSAFQIGKYEVTNREYVDYLNAALRTGEIVCEANVVQAVKGPFVGKEYCRLVTGPEFPQRFIDYREVEPGVFEFQVVPGFENFPMVRVQWFGAAAFCAFYGFRLPTEAEWEKAARGGQQFDFGTDNGGLDHDRANYVGQAARDQFEILAPVGAFPPNPFGVYDMSGNAAEFVFDLYSRTYYASSPSQDPFGPGPRTLTQSLAGAAIVRGGSCLSAAAECRTARRGSVLHQTDLNYLVSSILGFRVARSL